MTTSEVGAILVQLAEIKSDVKALRADNDRADVLHADHEARLRGLEKVRWIAAGVFLAGGGVGAALARLIGA